MKYQTKKQEMEAWQIKDVASPLFCGAISKHAWKEDFYLVKTEFNIEAATGDDYIMLVEGHLRVMPKEDFERLFEEIEKDKK